MSPLYYDAVLLSIQLEYPRASKWEFDSKGDLLVQMTELPMIGGIAGDIEIGDKLYALSKVFPMVYPGTDTAILIVKFEEIET